MYACINTTYRHTIELEDIAAVLAEHDGTVSATATATASKLQYQATVDFDSKDSSSSSSDSAAQPRVTIGEHNCTLLPSCCNDVSFALSLYSRCLDSRVLCVRAVNVMSKHADSLRVRVRL